MAAQSVTVKDFAKDLPGKVSDDGITYEFPELKTLGERGKNLIWQIIVRVVDSKQKPDSADYFVKIKPSYFVTLPDGLIGWMKVNSRYADNPEPKKSDVNLVTKGKNIGRSNETNPFTQALRDALGVYNKYRRRAEAPRITTADTTTTDLSCDPVDSTKTPRFPPMLAKAIKDLADPPNYAQRVFIQRKYNGVRAVAVYDIQQSRVIMYSRTGEIFPNTRSICDELAPILNACPGLYLDGELYVHGVELQDISGTARGTKDTGIALQYQIYDLFMPAYPNMIFSERLAKLRTIADSHPTLNRVFFTPTYELTAHDFDGATAEIKYYFNLWRAEKYEGAMVRLDMPYKYSYNGYHSGNLLKVKQRLDAEFTLVDISAGKKGKAVGDILYVCETKEGRQFTISSKGEIEKRKKLYAELMSIDPATGKTVFETKYKGKQLRVEFDELSKDGVPLRASVPEFYIRPPGE